jgi:hypothetical protein
LAQIVSVCVCVVAEQRAAAPMLDSAASVCIAPRGGGQRGGLGALRPQLLCRRPPRQGALSGPHVSWVRPRPDGHVAVIGL